MTKEQKELAEKIYEETDIDVAYMVENDMPDNIDDFMEQMQELVNEIEVIYYATAMEYLMENDTSLRESMELAQDMGCEPKNISSELLATLHKQQQASELIWEYKDEIEELFYSDNNE